MILWIFPEANLTEAKKDNINFKDVMILKPIKTRLDEGLIQLEEEHLGLHSSLPSYYVTFDISMISLITIMLENK